MNNSLNGLEKFQHLRATGPRSGRERSASPHPPTIRGDNQLSRWSINSVPSGSATSGPPAQHLKRRDDLHPTLSQAVEKYSRGEITYARVLRAGAMFIEGIASLSDTEREGTLLKFSEALDGAGGHRGELQRARGGSSTRREPERGEVGQRDWRELRTKDGRLRLSERDFPWYKSKADGTTSLTESQRKTRETLEYLRTDIEIATQWVKSAIGVPKHFPESEWKKILTGQTVNLERVRAFQCPRVPRETKFMKIKTDFDWMVAWNSTANATAFVFPHRRKELDEYGEHIRETFTVCKPASYYKIFRFDEEIREEVGGGESSSLLDRKHYQNFDIRVLDVFGEDQWDSGDRARERQQLCYRFNGKAGCSNSYCRYEHRCRSCKQGDHGQANCQKQGRNQKRWNKA